ncbi:hypothetical protein [Treponema pectinovorum]|uniref:hypothetical protein n=1 Tax=Treponema pectinovorum TaxID=164 RepID=UPI0011F38465|nr:hypothetical protein [Treponema pectinovorum]
MSEKKCVKKYGWLFASLEFRKNRALRGSAIATLACANGCAATPIPTTGSSHASSGATSRPCHIVVN